MPRTRKGWTLTLGALGIVYGDLGTNPLFALGEAFQGPHALAPSAVNVLGVLSLVFWALVAVVSVKYLAFLMRTHNHGEGGILALLALVPGEDSRKRRALVLVVLFGAALLYGDGVITPSLSVLSAVEGLELAAPGAARAIVPITVAILVGLFAFQHRGTERIGAWFGPVMALWFLSIGVLGLAYIAHNPAVLAALSPRYALRFLHEGGWHAFLALGAVVLCIAGGEALYADMGHFGRAPIARAWYALVFPSLLLNYFGQGAYLLTHGTPSGSTFYTLVPRLLIIPMVILATLATVIASQALISGAYSLTSQAIQLGLCPRLTIVHTSPGHRGQIYLPQVNLALMIACVALVIGFRASSRLVTAYGLAVTGTMTITSLAYYAVIRKRAHWPRWRALAIVAAFLFVDLSFLVANLPKLHSGGQVPFVLGLVVFTLMATWWAGRRTMAKKLAEVAFPFEALAEDLAAHPPHRVPGTAIFLSANPSGVPPSLFHHYKHNKSLHEQVVVLSILTARTPYVRGAAWVDVQPYGQGLYRATARIGFMETPDVPSLLARCAPAGLRIDPATASYYLGRETLVVRDRAWYRRAWKVLFALLMRNAQRAPAYFQIPAGRVVELGMQLEL